MELALLAILVVVVAYLMAHRKKRHSLGQHNMVKNMMVKNMFIQAEFGDDERWNHML